jgi:hypothetical protein
MKTQRSTVTDEEHRVLSFRPRTSPRPPARRVNGPTEPRYADAAPELLDLARYERPRYEPDDFRHRMLVNITACAFTVALIAVGIWLAVSIADLSRPQDCVLTGGNGCVRIASPHL